MITCHLFGSRIVEYEILERVYMQQDLKNVNKEINNKKLFRKFFFCIFFSYSSSVTDRLDFFFNLSAFMDRHRLWWWGLLTMKRLFCYNCFYLDFTIITNSFSLKDEEQLYSEDPMKTWPVCYKLLKHLPSLITVKEYWYHWLVSKSKRKT